MFCNKCNKEIKQDGDLKVICSHYEQVMKVQKKAKEQGHCCCNLLEKCPCVAWLRCNVCKCANFNV